MLGRLGALSSAMICPVIYVRFCLKFSIKQNKSIPRFGGNRDYAFEPVVSISAHPHEEAKTMMRIGTRISPDWLDRPEDLRFLTR